MSPRGGRPVRAPSDIDGFEKQKDLIRSRGALHAPLGSENCKCQKNEVTHKPGSVLDRHLSGS